ncbi:Dual specificity mitogen-activated protein kinase kinase 6 [Triplophysa tibetana]|uniref:mitogen-activated protein kinase kinase n=1 Tax=Triplophysa tibetana TaxID=1572043 RepID=A0A5A9PVT4_9TELE|nr:Dual specificity mitogen-activated protein kinase kinase 6 [Triplophysa tibetana]
MHLMLPPRLPQSHAHSHALSLLLGQDLEPLALSDRKKKPPLKLPKEAFEKPQPAPTPPRDLDSKACVTIGEKNFVVKADDLEQIGELGRGAYGVVGQDETRPQWRNNGCKAHPGHGKHARAEATADGSGHIDENSRLLLHSYLLRGTFQRDVKPSNVLINMPGQVKMCDFGISGYLVDSVAKTMDAGCKPYMAPERINPETNQKGYNVKSDIWSLGITMIELAILKFPYDSWGTPFQQLKQVVEEPSPQLPADRFSSEFVDFTTQCLKKNSKERPNYTELMQHPFFTLHDSKDTDVASFVKSILGD